MLTVPIFTGIFFSVILVSDAFKIGLQISFLLMIILGCLTYAILKSLIFDRYKIDKQEDGAGLNIFVTKGRILQAVLLYVVAFGIIC